MFKHRPAIRRKVFAVLSCTFLSVATARAAGELSLDIPAQDLGAAINQLAHQAKVQILFSAPLLDGHKAPALKGAYTPEAALRGLLMGSGLEVRARNDGTFALVAGPSSKRVGSAEEHLLGEVVVAATRTENHLARVPASVSVVTREDFEDRQASAVADVMKALPNVDFGGGPRIDGQIPTIRGYQGKQITLLVDGARRNEASALSSPLMLDPDLLARAEVVRGPSSSIYGTGGLGGAMVFRTIAAGDLLAEGKSAGADLKARYEDADRSMHYMARAYGRNDRVDGLVAFGTNDWQRIRQGGGSLLQPNDGDSNRGLAKVGLQASDRLRLELSHQFFNESNFRTNNPQADGAFGAGQAPAQVNHTKQDETVLKAMAANDRGEQALALTLYRNALKRNADKTASLSATRSETETTGASVQHTVELGGLGTGIHRLTYGADYFEDRQSAFSSGAPNPVIPNGVQKVLGLFVQDEIALGEAWRLVPSLRWDRYETSVESGKRPQATDSRPSPKLTAAWQALPELSIFASYGEAYRAPSLSETYQDLSGTNKLFNFAPNLELKPETDRTTEIGATYAARQLFTAKDSLRLRATAFQSHVSDLISNTVIGTYTRTFPFAGTGVVQQYQNVGNAKRDGGELEGSYRNGPFDLKMAYSRLRVIDRSNGNNLFAPPDKLAANIRYAFSGSSLWFDWGSVAVAAQDYDSTVLRRRPGYVVHSAFLSWMPHGQRLRIDFGVDNLFDKRYSVYQSGNAVANVAEAGRNLKLALSAQF
ncbi:MAG: TonB-dependent receptor [Candidatus Accumulibacter sp.]|nr:TonB-dependent receptor [Accumulibacter sp.]MBA4094363.1 TonB-dependent receptor [Accumulibacter sp.]